ncbi:semaphorin-4D-like [Thomomys bottae]
MLDGQIYAGTSTDYFGELQVISRYSHIHPLRTEYDTNLLYDPNFVFADVIRKGPDGPETDNDKVYFFFTEVPVEYDFFFKLKIPRVARVCKNDIGGQRDLQKRWTSFLKAKLICSQPDLGLIFNTLQDVFVLRTPDLKEPVFYALFTLQVDKLGLVQLSAVCAYTQSKIEEVFSQGKYMGVDNKWMPYSGPVPTPRPGACTNREAHGTKYTSSLNLPDETILFVRDHPLMHDSITPINNMTEFIKTGVNYTQIVVDRTQALDGKFYDVMFVTTEQGTLHKIIRLENIVYMIEETQLFQKSGLVQTLVLSSKKCIDSEAHETKYNSSLNLPSNILKFIRDHPLMDDAVTPINNKPQFIRKDIKYTQIVVDRTQALDRKFYDITFISTDRGTLHKAVNLKDDVYMIEETQLFQNSEPVQTLLLSSKKDLPRQSLKFCSAPLLRKKSKSIFFRGLLEKDKGLTERKVDVFVTMNLEGTAELVQSEDNPPQSRGHVTLNSLRLFW